MKHSAHHIQEDFKELFDMAFEVEDTTWGLLDKFNQREMKLFDFPPHQRIFLFVLTRSIKTYSSILHLCKQGYGQDVSNLLRTLLENLITVKYILRHKDTANDLAKRFVSYKWIIFKRHLADQEKNVPLMGEAEKEEFLKKKTVILKHVEEFKKTFNIVSDKALLTWSGKTVRDMAKFVDEKLLEEYETTFRLCSRFSHPSILGDQEYIIQDNKHLIFSPLPSSIGVVVNLKNAIKYMLEFLNIIDALYAFHYQPTLNDLRVKFAYISSLEKYQKDPSSAERNQNISASIKESIITFKTSLEEGISST